MTPTAARSAHLRASLLLATLLVVGGFSAIQVALYGADKSSVLTALRTFFGDEGEPGADSWMPMRAAYEWIASGGPGTLYQELFFHQQIKFIYPPSSLLILSTLTGLGLPPTDALLDRIGWFAILVTTATVAG